VAFVPAQPDDVAVAFSPVEASTRPRQANRKRAGPDEAAALPGRVAQISTLSGRWTASFGLPEAPTCAAVVPPIHSLAPARSVQAAGPAVAAAMGPAHTILWSRGGLALGSASGRVMVLGLKSADERVSDSGDAVAGRFGTVLASVMVGSGAGVTALAVTGAPDAATVFPTCTPLARQLGETGGEADDGELLLLRRSVTVLAACDAVVTAWGI